jgi:hypothetical protein
MVETKVSKIEADEDGAKEKSLRIVFGICDIE